MSWAKPLFSPSTDFQTGLRRAIEWYLGELGPGK